VYQYGVDYIEITCPGTYTLTFQGTQAVNILPFGEGVSTFFWSNLGDESNMSLQRSFDLSSVSGSAELSFRTWYDLEKDYDFVFFPLDGRSRMANPELRTAPRKPSGTPMAAVGSAVPGLDSKGVDLSALSVRS
jgi:bacillopeptidase F (M6 metalloprotease family)